MQAVSLPWMTDSGLYCTVGCSVSRLMAFLSEKQECKKRMTMTNDDECGKGGQQLSIKKNISAHPNTLRNTRLPP